MSTKKGNVETKETVTDGIVIEKMSPVGFSKRGRQDSKYPLAQMKAGDGFRLKKDEVKIGAVRAAVQNFQKRNPDSKQKFSVLTNGDEIGVFCI